MTDAAPLSHENFENQRAAITRVFISYSRKDMAFVDRLENELIKHGVTVYIDRSEIDKGVDWWERICQLIGKSDTVLFVLSPDALRSTTCAREVEYAVELGKRLIPAVCSPVDDADVPDTLVKINYVFFPGTDPSRLDLKFSDAVNDLVTALKTDLSWVKEHTRIGELARHWEAMKRPEDQLLHGRPLHAAVGWLQDTLAGKSQHQLDQGDLIYTFVQASGQQHYVYGWFHWRSPLVAFPLIILATLLFLVGFGIVSLSSEALTKQLGIDNLKDFVHIAGWFGAMLFAIYVILSVHRRYMIARCVCFFREWKAWRYALRIVVYHLIWLGIAYFLVQR